MLELDHLEKSCFASKQLSKRVRLFPGLLNRKNLKFLANISVDFFFVQLKAFSYWEYLRSINFFFVVSVI